MKLGAEPKKLAILVGLLVVAGITYYIASSDGSSPAPANPRASVPAEPAPAVSARVNTTPRAPRSANRNLVREFKPSLGVRDPKDRPDPATIDPTLRLDLLAKVQNIEVGPPGRNLFQFGSAPPPPAALPKLPNPGKIIVSAPAPPPPPVNMGPPPPPQAPPMTFKYYGYKISKSDGHKAAFLLDGDDILIAGENDTVKKRFRVVKIGLNSITIEDTQFNSTQTLPIQENPVV